MRCQLCVNGIVCWQLLGGKLSQPRVRHNLINSKLTCFTNRCKNRNLSIGFDRFNHCIFFFLQAASVSGSLLTFLSSRCFFAFIRSDSRALIGRTAIFFLDSASTSYLLSLQKQNYKSEMKNALLRRWETASKSQSDQFFFCRRL